MQALLQAPPLKELMYNFGQSPLQEEPLNTDVVGPPMYLQQSSVLALTANVAWLNLQHITDPQLEERRSSDSQAYEPCSLPSYQCYELSLY